MKKFKRHRGTALALLLGFSGLAQAHYLWIEQEPAAAKVYFGEWAEDLREKDSGPMKAIQGLKAFDETGKELKLERKADYFLIAKPPAGDLRLYDEVMHRSSKVIYDIRSGRSQARATASFEIMPVTPMANTFVLMLEGKPLPKTEVKLFGPPKWEKHYTTDEAGRFTIETPWSGFYLMRASSEDESAGEFEGKKFDKIINVAILSFTVEQGLAWKTPD